MTKLETRMGNQEIHTQYLLAAVKQLKRALEGGKLESGSKCDRWCARAKSVALGRIYEGESE